MTSAFCERKPSVIILLPSCRIVRLSQLAGVAVTALPLQATKGYPETTTTPCAAGFVLYFTASLLSEFAGVMGVSEVKQNIDYFLQDCRTILFSDIESVQFKHVPRAVFCFCYTVMLFFIIFQNSLDKKTDNTWDKPNDATDTPSFSTGENGSSSRA